MAEGLLSLGGPPSRGLSFSHSDFPPTRVTLIQRLPDPSDHEAWEAFVDLYGPVIFAFARHRGCAACDAADVVQEVLAKVTRRIRTFDFDPTRGRFRSWLYLVVKSHLIDRLRKEAIRPRLVGGGLAEHRLNEYVDESESSEKLWEVEYQRQLLHRALPTLKSQFADSTWRAFVRTAMEDADPALVAKELNMSLGAVYVAKSRVLSRLREKVAVLEYEWETWGDTPLSSATRPD